jgi:hypothetical protein
MQPEIELFARDLGGQLAHGQVGELVLGIVPGSLGSASARKDRRSSQPEPVSAEIMKVRANSACSLALAVSSSSASRLTRSILLRTRILGWRTSLRLARISPASPLRPRSASISTSTMSASRAPPQAVVTMARSSRRFGRKMPGVSTKTIWVSPWVAMPRTMARVVCTLWVTIDTLAPTSWFRSVDLPALGAPISATKPERVETAAGLVIHGRHPSRPFASEQAAAAACSASRLERPSATAGSRPPTVTLTVKTGS